MARQYNLMSADGHLEVPPERWVHRVPEKYRDRTPHTVHLPDGGDALMIEGQPLLEANFLDLRAGRAEGTWQPFGLKVAVFCPAIPHDKRTYFHKVCCS